MRALLLALLLVTPSGGAPSASPAARSVVTPTRAASPSPAVAIRRDAERARATQRVEAFRARWRDSLTRRPSDPAARLALLTIDRLTYRYAAAERSARALAQTPALRGTAWAAAAQLELALAFSQRGLPQQARPLLDAARAAARTAGEAALEVEAGVAAIAARSTREPAATLLPVLDSLDARRPNDDAWLEPLVTCRRATVRSLSGRRDVTTALRDAVVRARAADAPVIAATCQLALREHFLRSAQFDSAGPAQEALQPLLDASGDRSLAAVAEQSAGYSLQLLGRIDLARAAITRAIEHATVSGHVTALGRALSTRAQLAREGGDSPAALDDLRRAQSLLTTAGDALGLRGTRFLAASLRADAGDRVGARTELETLVREAEQAGALEGVRDAWATLARLHRQSGDLAAARAALARADDTNRRLRGAGWVPALQWERATIALRGGAPAEAAVLFDSIGRTVHPTQRKVRYELALLRAEADARLGKPFDAERRVVEGAAQLDQWRAETPDSVLRTQLVTTADARFDTDVAFAEVLARVVAERPATVLALAEQRRARELRDRLLARRRSARGAANEGVDSTARAVMAALDAQTALLSFVAGPAGASGSLVLVTRAGVRGWRLPPGDSVTPLVARWQGRLARGVSGGAATAAGADPFVADPSATALARALLHPALGALPAGVTRLLVVADGPLAGVPFEALPMVDGRPLVSRYALWQAPSVAVALLLDGARSAAGAPSRWLAMGAPTMPSLADSGATAHPAARVARAAGGLPPLPAAGAEARAVVAGRSADLRLGAEASEGWLRRAPVGEYRVLHFATHALVDARSDAGVALVLAPGDGADGFLTLDEIAALPLRADLVVLAACRTAAGSGRADTPRTLATTFLSAGARSVLATRWPVPDRAAARFVTAFVAAARPGVPLAEALAAAQRARRQAGERSAVWGAFTLVGAGRHTL